MDVSTDKKPFIGRNIFYHPESELMNALNEKDTWPPETCWFCGARNAEKQALLLYFPFKEESRSFNGSKWIIEGEELLIKIPRCEPCKKVHRFRKVTPYISLPVLFIVWLGPILLLNAFNIRLTERYIFEPIFFMVLGIAAFILTWTVLIPKIFTPGAKETQEEAK